MLMEPVAAESGDPDVLERLRRLCRERGLDLLADNLADLAELVSEDMVGIERGLEGLERGDSLAERAAAHLMGAGGKRLRPMCVALASRVGSGFDERGLDLAVSVELVHNATLLHDDVIDLAPTRRGLPTARTEYGNAASIFGGDWLLVEALRRVRRAGVADTLDRLLDTIETMIRAESLQLERRGRLDTPEDVYFRIVEGKSAVLFRWALYAGARAGELDGGDAALLEEFGSHLGVAFQIVDDLLDYTGRRRATGKELFTDLREGKMTHPLILGVARRPALQDLLQRVVEAPADSGDGAAVDPLVSARILRMLEETGALEDSRAVARDRVELAQGALSRMSRAGSEAAVALGLVAQSTLHRDR